MQKERVVNALIKIFKGDIEFSLISDYGIRFKHRNREFKVRDLFIVEEVVDKCFLTSNKYTSILTKTLTKELS